MQRYLDVALGAVLLLAGALKGQQLLMDPSVGRASGFPRELLIGASAFELAFGCWLLAGLYRSWTRWISLGWFTSLAAVALAQAFGGAPSCACLGELHASPWVMFAFDVAAVAALWMWSPNGFSSSQHLLLVLCLSLLPAAILLGLSGIPRPEPLFAEIDLGDIPQGGQKQQAFQLRNDMRYARRGSRDRDELPVRDGPLGSRPRSGRRIPDRQRDAGFALQAGILGRCGYRSERRGAARTGGVRAGDPGACASGTPSSHELSLTQERAS